MPPVAYPRSQLGATAAAAKRQHWPRRLLDELGHAARVAIRVPGRGHRQMVICQSLELGRRTQLIAGGLFRPALEIRPVIDDGAETRGTSQRHV